MNFIKKVLSNKIYSLLILCYILFQFFWPLSEVFYFASIVTAVIWINKNYNKNKNYRAVFYTLTLNLFANTLLTIFYYFTILRNPNINWSIQDNRQESDPMILLFYFPMFNFILFLIVIFVETMAIKISKINN